MDFATKFSRGFLFFDCFSTFATHQYFLSLDKCFPIPPMIPRNRRPTFASRVRRNIVYIVVRSLSLFTMRNLGPACISRNFLLSRIDTRTLGSFFWWSPKLPKHFLNIFVLQTAPTTVSHFVMQMDVSIIRIIFVRLRVSSHVGGPRDGVAEGWLPASLGFTVPAESKDSKICFDFHPPSVSFAFALHPKYT